MRREEGGGRREQGGGSREGGKIAIPQSLFSALELYPRTTMMRTRRMKRKCVFRRNRGREKV